MGEDRATTFLNLIRRAQRGRLKIYLGYGPGVGKTYQMLSEAHRLRRDGIDVVVGVVETHGRAETAKQVEGLELVPRREVEYRGIKLDAMDLDLVLARKPQVVLVDELAHTNVPGSRNGKRYEDVREILAAGIHVIATLNVQHLESLYNTVERLVGVKVRERIPDRVLAEADQVVNVDLTPEDLQQRLREGKIYPKDRVAPALENFFTGGNLEHLRELTLRELASQIDSKRREVLDEGDKIAPDQIMVCLASKGPNSARLLRFASRLAGRLNRNWYAVYVQTPSEDPTLIDATTQRLLADTLTLANQLGATVFTFKGQDVVDTILRFAREYRVGHIVIGRPRSIPWWQRHLLGKRSVAEGLLLRAEGFSVVVVDATTVVETRPSVDEGSVRDGSDRDVKVSSVLAVGRVVILDEALSKREILVRLIALIAADRSGIDLDATLDSVVQREAQGSTFLNEGVAVPHAVVPALEASVGALALLRQGLSDGEGALKVEAVFLLLEPTDAEKRHVSLLTQAVRVLQDAAMRRCLAGAADAAEVLACLEVAEGP